MQHVLSTITSASSGCSAGRSPSASSSPTIRSESCSFIWHPKVRTAYVLALMGGSQAIPCLATGWRGILLHFLLGWRFGDLGDRVGLVEHLQLGRPLVA